MEQKEIKETEIKQEQPVEKDYYTKQEVESLLSKKIVEYLGSFIKKQDTPQEQKQEIKTEKVIKEDDYEW